MPVVSLLSPDLALLDPKNLLLHSQMTFTNPKSPAARIAPHLPSRQLPYRFAPELAALQNEPIARANGQPPPNGFPISADISLSMVMQFSILRPLVRATLIVAVAGATGWLWAAATPIGMAIANGSIQVDHAPVWGSATLFDGTLVETTAASSQLQLYGGAEMRLAANTRVTVYRNRLVLDNGYGEVRSASGFEVDARSLRIAAAPDTVARIRLKGDRQVTVAAVHGGVRVLNASGLLVAAVDQGYSLDFEPQAAGAAAPTKASGCLLAKAGKFILADQTTNVVLEVHGTGLDKELGNRVEISGISASDSASVSGATQLIQVAGLKEIGKGGCSAVAKKIGATTAIAAGATAGTSAGTTAAGAGAGTAAAGAAGAATAAGAGIGVGTIAVIGGVAAAATVGGLAAVGSLPGQGSSNPPAASR